MPCANLINEELKRYNIRKEMNESSVNDNNLIIGDDDGGTERANERITSEKKSSQICTKSMTVTNGQYMRYLTLLIAVVALNFVGEVITVVIAETHRGNYKYTTVNFNDIEPLVYDTNNMDNLMDRGDIVFTGFEANFTQTESFTSDYQIGSYPFIPGSMLENITAEYNSDILCGMVDRWQRVIVESGPTPHLWMLPMVLAYPTFECHVNGTNMVYGLGRADLFQNGTGDRSQSYDPVSTVLNTAKTNVTLAMVRKNQLKLLVTKYTSEHSNSSSSRIYEDPVEFVSKYYTAHTQIAGNVTMAVAKAGNTTIFEYDRESQADVEMALTVFYIGGNDIVLTYTELDTTGPGTASRIILSIRYQDGWATMSRIDFETKLYSVPINGLSDSVSSVSNLILDNIPDTDEVDLGWIVTRPAVSASLPECLIAIAHRYNFKYIGGMLNENYLKNTGIVVYNVAVGVLIMIFLGSTAMSIRICKLMRLRVGDGQSVIAVPGIYDYMHALYERDGGCMMSLLDIITPTYTGSHYDREKRVNHVGIRTNRSAVRPRKGIVYASKSIVYSDGKI